MKTNTIEDYLKALYELYEAAEDTAVGIRSVDIAKKLGIRKPSVSAIVKKMTKLGYIKSKPYSPVFFTEKGLRDAKRIIHNHRVIEYFLKETLKCDLKEVHGEAHKLEHAFSDPTIRRLDKYLGNPTVSPYGKRIH